MDYPICFKDRKSLDVERRLCRSCPWLYTCGTLLGHDFNVDRRQFIRRSLLDGVPSNDANFVAAVAHHYRTSVRKAKLAINYIRKTL